MRTTLTIAAFAILFLASPVLTPAAQAQVFIGPRVVAPRRVVVAPAPVFVQPRVVVGGPVMFAPRPVMVGPGPVVVRPNGRVVAPRRVIW